MYPYLVKAMIVNIAHHNAKTWNNFLKYSLFKHTIIKIASLPAMGGGLYPDLIKLLPDYCLNPYFL